MSAKDHNQTFDLQKPDSATSDRPLRTNPELNAKRFGPSFMGREGQSIPDGETDGPDTLSIAVFVVVALIVIAAGVYVMRPEKKT